jgi:soluble lytic murein transglycosylase-like protein
MTDGLVKAIQAASREANAISQAAQAAAEEAGLPGELVWAVVMVESGGNPAAIRYEPGFDARYGIAPGGFIPPGCSRATEEVGRAMSWGLMQIMGETARAIGFQGCFPELCSPAIGLAWGCRYLRRLADRYGAEGWDVVCRAYNGGPGNRHNLENEYPAKILKHLGGTWPQKGV